MFRKLSFNLKNLIHSRYYFATKIIPVKLSDLGEGTKEATVKKWFKNKGDLVKEEENILEVETDKLVAEIPSPAKGIIHEIYYDVNESCLVGNALYDLAVEENDSAGTTTNSSQKQQTHLEQNKVEKDDIDFDSFKTTPATRHLIRKYNINPAKLNPTGKDGRILKEDVLGFMKNNNNKSVEYFEPKKQDKVQTSTKCEMTKSTETLKSKPSSALQQQPLTRSLNDEVVKLTGFKKAMVKTMTQSSTIPSFLFTDEYNVDKLVKLRKELNKLDNKIKITYMPFLIKAISLALEEYTLLNSHTNPETDSEGYINEYVIKKDHNISIAIDSRDGLVVPNIKRVQDKTIIQIQRELNVLREKAESRKLTHEDLKDGTFTISNIGNIGGKVLSPVILPPQTCIIGISKFFDSLTVMDKDSEVSESQAYHLLENKNLLVVFHKTVNICISADHRVIDGATVARFSTVLKNYIENPLKIWTAN